jgi:hypothetical protein
MLADRARAGKHHSQGVSNLAWSIYLAAAAGIVALGLALVLPATAVAAPSSEEPADCGSSTLVIERAGVAAFELPRQSGEKLEIDPKEPLTLRFKNPPPIGHVDLTLKLPFGQSISKSYEWSALARTDEFVLDIGPEDYGRFADLARGAYPLEVTTFSADTPVCTVPFQVSLGLGISGPIGAAAAATSAAAAATALAAAGGVARTATPPPPVSLKVAVERRRKQGWRKYGPVPSLKRTIIASLMGTVTGIAITLALQQSGIEALTSFTLVRNAVVGALGSISTGVAWGSVLSFIRKPVDDDAKDLPKAGAGAPPVA